MPARLNAGLPLAGVLLLPLGWSLWASLGATWQPQAWAALWADPQTSAASGLSLWTGLASTILACALAAWIASVVLVGAGQARWQRWLAPMLAVPHAAFAIGLVALLAPSGWVLRALSPWATGLDAPPPWYTTQDPWGLGLIAALVCKEVPFLLWCAAAWLQRPDVGQRLQRELQLAATLGYAPSTAWWRVALPQLAPRLAAPVLAVWAYSLTVVDMALVIGPGTPPTLAVLAWQWLQDADTARNAQGAAAAGLLLLVLVVGAVLVTVLQRGRWLRQRWSAGVPTADATRSPWRGLGAHSAATTLALVYAAVLLALLLGSVVGSWPFPALWPETVSLAAWQSVLESASTVQTTLWLGLAASGTALLWVVAWLEWGAGAHTPRTTALVQWALILPLVMPALLWVVGLHRLVLAWGLGHSGWGLWLVHTLVCLPYVYLALVGPYTGFSPQAWQVAASLGRSRSAFLWRIKWPLLRSALASAFAVGFAVSVAQYLPTLYVGAGRFATVTTEAIALAAGGQRSLAAAFAWLQWLLPVLVFALAAWLGRARRFDTLGRPA
ncbi:ABC transporter permease [Rhodoferax sp.]|jgi:putative thiamine transport system permease protein|uniref:ABC transporter permease n=1 Tax=Rhodoferax sp. TaxID=50421 RepID=UPI0037848F0C